ncbi:MAG: ABC transporter ATP-binding protein [Candidatus Latescibacterota bacterium]
MNTPAVRTENLVRDFKMVRAVDHISLEVPSGIVFGFLGPNGAGKTTMIRLLLGLLEPTGGHAEVLGYDVRSQSSTIREKTGTLLEHTGLYERLSAEDNLEFYARVSHIPRAERKARIQELLTHFGLWERRKENVGVWSRGMKQKLAVARTILHRPAFIFLDEPTAGLDPVASAALRDDLAKLAAGEGITVFLTTHNLSEAEKLCARVGVINRGKLIVVGSPDELRAKIGKPRTEITGQGFTSEILASLRARPDIVSAETENGRLLITASENTPMSPIVRFLVGAGAEIEEVQKVKASLEEAFLTLMEEDR